MQNEPMRVLITVSRTWDAPDVIHDELDLVAMDAREQRRPLVVVHGDNPRGDHYGKAWALERAAQGWPVSHEPHPADWNGPCRAGCTPGHRRERPRGGTYCPAAGQYRNADMVDAGADRCLAFIRDNSSGASNCARLAKAAGIPTPTHHYPED